MKRSMACVFTALVATFAFGQDLLANGPILKKVTNAPKLASNIDLEDLYELGGKIDYSAFDKTRVADLPVVYSLEELENLLSAPKPQMFSGENDGEIHGLGDDGNWKLYAFFRYTEEVKYDWKWLDYFDDGWHELGSGTEFHPNPGATVDAVDKTLPEDVEYHKFDPQQSDMTLCRRHCFNGTHQGRFKFEYRTYHTVLIPMRLWGGAIINVPVILPSDWTEIVSRDMCNMTTSEEQRRPWGQTCCALMDPDLDRNAPGIDWCCSRYDFVEYSYCR